MVIFEDLHWIDEATQEFLNLLADSLGTAKILLLVNYRPEYSHQWNSKTYYTQLRLDPLGRESANEMLSALLGDGKDLLPLKRVIVEKTEGNPFFMEETVQVLLDEGALVREGTTVRLTRPLGELKIPPTVQGILAARIDRMPADAKALLQTLAVIGREFSLSLIRAVVSKSEDELNRLLNDLQLGEFIYEQPALGDTEYEFKHALTQEVAYNSVLMERRQQLHERTAAALETLYASSIDDHLAELAHHYGRTNNSDKAVQYHGRAAQQALSRSAFDEALSLGREGLALVPELAVSAERGQREFSLLSTLVRAASAIEGYGSPHTAMGYRRMLEIARESGDEATLFAALYGMWMEHNIAARHQEAMELAGQMAQVAERRNSQAALADALTAQGWTLFLTGHYGDALAALNRAITICRDGARRISVDGNDPLVFSLVCAGVSAWVAGYPTQALSVSESAVKRARDLNQPLSLAFALLYQSWVRSWRGELNATSDSCDRLEVLVENGGIKSFLGPNRVNQGWVAGMRGEHEQGINLIRSGIATWAPNVFTYHSSILAEFLMRADRHQEVVEAVSAARDHALRTGERHGESEIERIAGELLMRQDVANNAEAEQCLRHAIALAQEMQAKSWELRATISLARLLRDTGRRDEARSILAEICNWFTEGFDTADLKDAKALLDELNG